MVLPVRDGLLAGPGLLDAALRSVRASRGISFEAICVDDGSCDGTPATLRRHASEDARVRVIHTPRRGIVSALNIGLRAARGEFVARMDADDEMHPERLARQAERLRAESSLGLVGCQVECVRSDGLREGYRLYAEWVNGLVTHEAIAREAFVECPVPHPTWMLRTRPALALGGYREESWPEDLDFLYRLLASGARIAKLPAKLHRWRDHESRLSRVDPRYERPAFARAKARFLPELRPLAGAVVWGAGRTGRRFVRLLEERGVATRALIDINAARTGTSWRGIPILAPAALEGRVGAWRREGLRLLGAVASRGARAEIRHTLQGLGLAEGEDFLMVA